MKKRCYIYPLVIVILTGLLGGYFTNTVSSSYQALVKPSFMPRGEVFMIAWTIIYVLTYFVAVNACKNNDTKAILLLLFNAVFNSLWSYVFFYKENIVGAFLIILILIADVILLIKQVENRKDKLFLLPYLLWLLIALALNYSIILLN